MNSIAKPSSDRALSPAIADFRLGVGTIADGEWNRRTTASISSAFSIDKQTPMSAIASNQAAPTAVTALGLEIGDILNRRPAPSRSLAPPRSSTAAPTGRPPPPMTSATGRSRLTSVALQKRSLQMQFVRTNCSRKLRDEDSQPSRVLYVSVQQLNWPITEEVLKEVFSRTGKVEHIAILSFSPTVEALVQYDSSVSAIKAWDKFHGRQIYDGCCRIDVQFASMDSIPKCWTSNANKASHTAYSTNYESTKEASNRVILVTIDQEMQLAAEDMLKQVLSNHGIVGIVIACHYPNVQALVQFSTNLDASIAKISLDVSYMGEESCKIATRFSLLDCLQDMPSVEHSSHLVNKVFVSAQLVDPAIKKRELLLSCTPKETELVGEFTDKPFRNEAHILSSVKTPNSDGKIYECCQKFFAKEKNIAGGSTSRVEQLSAGVANVSLVSSEGRQWEILSRKPSNRGGSSSSDPWVNNQKAWGQPDVVQKLEFHAAPQPEIAPSLPDGWNWKGRHAASQFEGGNESNKVHFIDKSANDDSNNDDDSDAVDSDDELLSDDFDSDESVKSHDTRKQSRWFKGFFKSLEHLTLEQISEPGRQWHCPACAGGPGAIDWYVGLQPRMAHAKTKGSKRVKLHRDLAELLDKELRRRGTSVVPTGEAFGKWTGLAQEVKDREIFWPSMVFIMNTQLDQDDNDKWIGMGNDLSADWFGISCIQGNISVINCQKMGLTGSISPEFASLKLLTILDLADNNLTGTIPSELTNLTSLSEINVKNNKLHGEVPTFRSNITVLTNDIQTISNSESGDVHMVEVGNMIISIQVLRSVTNNFSPDYILGHGGFGTVYKGELYDGTKIAVKRMECGMITGKGLAEITLTLGNEFRQKRAALAEPVSLLQSIQQLMEMVHPGEELIAEIEWEVIANISRSCRKFARTFCTWFKGPDPGGTSYYDTCHMILEDKDLCKGVECYEPGQISIKRN